MKGKRKGKRLMAMILVVMALLFQIAGCGGGGGSSSGGVSSSGGTVQGSGN